jgi:Tfp pilus assembly protein PilO
MDARRGNQVWLVGGTLVIIMLIAASWFFLISPKFAQADEIRAEADTASMQLIKLKSQVADLQKKEATKPTILANLRSSQAALPTSNNMQIVLRRVQDAELALGVTVSSVTVSVPVKSTTLPAAVDIPITMLAVGAPAEVSGFLVRLQTVYSRALLIRTVSLTVATNEATNKLESTLSLGLSAFCLKPVKASATENCALS